MFGEGVDNTVKVHFFKEVVVLSEGASFGELALINSMPR